MTTVKDEKQRIDYLLSRDNTTDRELEKIYLEAVNLLRSIISEEFNSYAVDGVLTPQDLTRRVTKKDMVLLKKLYDQLPDNLELSEQQRVNYYLASSQTSLSRLLIASIGIALVGVTHKVAKIIRKNNKRAVREEYNYRRRSMRAPRRGKANQIGEDNYELPKMAVPWLDRLWLDHDQMLNRIDNQITSMLKQGMRAQDIAEKLFPGNAESMRKDNIPETLINASVSAKRLARTEAAAREDEVSELFLINNKTKYYDWVTERGACRRCTAIALAGPYKVGDINSPRIPIDSHPNCRCRRIPAEVETDEGVDRGKKALAAGIVSGIGKRDGKKENAEKASKEDSKEYEEIVSVLGEKNAPESLKEFQRMKYNDVERYKELKDRVIWKQAEFPTQKSFNGHFKKHAKEFEEELTKEQYQEMAADLLSQPISDNVLGYETEEGRRVRYDKSRNIIVIGNLNSERARIATMMRPIKEEEYYHENYRRDHSN